MKKITQLVLFVLFQILLLSNISAQMSKDLVKVEPKAPIENVEGEPELLPFKDRLKALIDKEPLFLNPDISEQEIARLLRTSPSVVEAIMQSDFGQDYDTFINSRRVKSAIELFNHEDFQDLDYEDKAVKESVLSDIARQCGFKSVSYFARQFKKHQGMSVDDYLEEELMGE